MQSKPNLLKLKFLSILILHLFFHEYSIAQQPRPLPASYSSGVNLNYVRIWDATSPQTDPNAMLTKPLRDVKQSTQYFDGLGRPIQTVIKQGSLITGGTAVDMVSAVEYDEFGREQFSYLPFASTATNGTQNNGLFKMDPFQQQASFYSSTDANKNPIAGQGEDFFYGQTVFENSPLNRVQKSMAPGDSWTGNSRGVEMKYWINTLTDAVRIWDVTNVTNTFGTYSTQPGTAGIYPAGELYKIISLDEHGKQVIEFKDKEGKVILKKVQLTAAAETTGTGSGHDGWICTYYIYDDLNNLRCVIQPEGVISLADPIKANWNLGYLSGILLNEQCFRYEYDQRNRMIMKKVPGAEEIYMIYDARDRLVMTQDANLRTINKWMVTLYDNLNRPIQTGLLLNTYFGATPRTFIQHMGYATPSPPISTFTPYPFDPSIAPAAVYWEELTKTFYDNYDWLASTGNPFSADRSTEHDHNFLTPSNTTYPYPQPLIQSFSTKGMVTGTKTKVLGTSQYLFGINYYDAKGRVIQAQNYNITGWASTLQTQYDFSGKILKQVFGSPQNLSPSRNDYLISSFEYDDLGRLSSIRKKPFSYYNGVWLSGTETETVRNEYDALGQLKKKKIGKKTGGAAPLANLNYDYNIRGWLLSVNKDYIASSANTDQYFGMQLGYDNNGSLGTFTPQYNGNISGTIWKSEGDQQKRKYDFTYDAANRLTSADFNQYASGTGATALFNKAAGINFSLSNLTFNANGNILTMDQAGLKLNTSPVIDQLRYTYIANSNMLKSVKDFMNDPITKLGDFKTNTTHPQAAIKTALSTSSTQAQFDAIIDYAYDLSGNLTADNNKSISSITYNHLNLPSVVTVTGKGTIAYTYDAAGNKLKKVTTEANVTVPFNGTNHISNIITTTTYLGAGAYESKDYVNTALNSLDIPEQLQFIVHEEGRIRFLKATTSTCPSLPDRFVFDYFLKDHLGNVRSVITEQKEDICYIAATVEDANYQLEDDVYHIVNARRITKYTTGATQTSFGNKLYRVHGGLPNEKTGLAITLKVMAGDQVKIMAESFHTIPGGGPGVTTMLSLTELLTAFAGSSAITSTKGIVAPSTISVIGTNTTQLNSIINNSNGTGNARAFINWILFDEQLKYVDGGVDPVVAGGGYKLHTALINSPVNVTKNGFLYIYVSNESNMAVYFDNLSVTHMPGPLLEESHYYPFGLTMTGISSKAASFGSANNKYKYNRKEEQRQEFSDGSGLEWLDYGARMYDNQIGRWHVLDNYSETYLALTPYNYCGNNPINAIDIDGNLFIFANGFMLPHWQAGNAPKTLPGSIREGVSGGPNPNYKPYVPERGFYDDGPRNNGQRFSYWDGVDKAYKKYNSDFEGEKAYYTNGSFTPMATANARFNEGLAAGADLIAKLEAGEITLKDGETIKIVGHSHGAAYAAGIASTLAKHSKYGALIEFVDYLSPHQPGDIKHPTGVKGRQFSTWSDWVSSIGLLAAHTSSEFEKIPGTEWGVKRGVYEGSKGGHDVGSWLNDLVDYWRSLGITVTVH